MCKFCLIFLSFKQKSKLYTEVERSFTRYFLIIKQISIRKVLMCTSFRWTTRTGWLQRAQRSLRSYFVKMGELVFNMVNTTLSRCPEGDGQTERERERKSCVHVATSVHLRRNRSACVLAAQLAVLHTNCSRHTHIHLHIRYSMYSHTHTLTCTFAVWHVSFWNVKWTLLNSICSFILVLVSAAPASPGFLRMQLDFMQLRHHNSSLCSGQTLQAPKIH